jgi:hypothetical protein
VFTFDLRHLVTHSIDMNDAALHPQLAERAETPSPAVTLLACLALFNISDAAVTIRNEYRYPYSGAPDVVHYLNSVGAGRQPIFGYLYGMAAVQAYYDHNILANIPTTYFHHGLPRFGNSMDEEELDRLSPEYVILFSEAPQIMFDHMNGYLNAKG